MSYAESIIALWKPWVLALEDQEAEYKIQFSLFPKNEQLKSYKVHLMVGIDDLNGLILKYVVSYKRSRIPVLGKGSYRVSYQQVFEDGHLDMIDLTIGNLISEVENLVFDKFTGKFMNFQNNELKNSHNFQLTIRKNMNDAPECCVCKEFCGTTTWCGHTLCLECYNKLTSRKTCPLCRCSIDKVKMRN